MINYYYHYYYVVGEWDIDVSVAGLSISTLY